MAGKAKTKTVYKMVLMHAAWLLANNLVIQLQPPAGVA
jgi:hypothetical protein